MISLDEDFLGRDPTAIIVRGLKVCGGLLCVMGNGDFVGAHFTNITTPAEIYTACLYMVNHFFLGSQVADMYFIYNMSGWALRNDKYANPGTLISELKIMMHYQGTAKVYDKNIIGLSVDVKLESVGNVVQIGHRITPNPDPSVQSPNINVLRVKSQFGSNTPSILQMGGAYTHKLPAAVGGFTPFVPSLFAYL